MSSLWIDTTNELDQSKSLGKDLTCDVCIIGAGIAGLSTGYYLCKQGLKVIILDKSYIGTKTSGNTTGKITFQHNLIYDYLINSKSEKYAKAYLDANKKAILNIKNIIDEEQIDCDFENQANYVYTTKQEELHKIHKEIQALHILGEEAEFVTNCDLPFKIVGALKENNQAQIHLRKYMLGLANCIKQKGGEIYTNSTVINVKKDNNEYITFANNYEIKSKYIIQACHYPFINFPGFYFSKMYQSTSYVIAVDTHTNLFGGMYINPHEPIYSFRTAKFKDKRLLLIAGADHKTGFAPDENKSYKLLENFAKKHYPKSEILYKWNTRDCISLDKIPYIGEFSSLLPNAYVATGFNKWGITGSNIAANIITDKILGKENKYAFVFDSRRVEPIKNREEVKNMTSQVFKSFISNRIKIPHADLEQIKNDNGGIIKLDGINIGIYKDASGNIFAINPTCTHLGCLLTWNNLDKTWDCPCHGSRFNFKGENIYDPAFKNLDKFEIL